MSVLKNKTIAILILLTAIVNFSCKKDNDATPEKDCSNEQTISNNYNDITYCEVRNNDSLLSNQQITGVDVNGYIKLNEDDILIYKTDKGRFGKMQIINVDASKNYELSFRAITFNSDGGVYSEKDTVVIRGTFSCDLDDLKEYGTDFWWERDGTFDTYITVEEAKISRYLN